MRRYWIVPLLALVAACGLTAAPPPAYLPQPLATPRAAPTPKPTVAPKKKKPKTPVAASATASTVAAIPAPVPTPVAVPLYQAAIKTYLGFRSYTGDVQTYGKSQGKDIGAKAKLFWKQPNHLRVEIVETNISKGDQTVIVDTGSGPVRAKAPGWWPFPVTVERSDPKLQLPGGPRFDEATVGGVLAQFQAAGASVEEQGDITFLGKTVTEYHVRNAVLTARGVTHARIGIDPTTRWLVFCEHVGAAGIATQLVFSALTPDAPVADDRFSL